MTHTDGFEVIRGARSPRPFYLLIDRSLATLSPRTQALVHEASEQGIMVLGWSGNGTEDRPAISLASFCALYGVDPQRAAFIGNTARTEKVAFGTAYPAETESDLIDALMDILA